MTYADSPRTLRGRNDGYMLEASFNIMKLWLEAWLVRFENRSCRDSWTGITASVRRLVISGRSAAGSSCAFW